MLAVVKNSFDSIANEALKYEFNQKTAYGYILYRKRQYMIVMAEEATEKNKKQCIHK